MAAGTARRQQNQWWCGHRLIVANLSRHCERSEAIHCDAK
jgi:hypothetical protein